MDLERLDRLNSLRKGIDKQNDIVENISILKERVEKEPEDFYVIVSSHKYIEECMLHINDSILGLLTESLVYEEKKLQEMLDEFRKG